MADDANIPGLPAEPRSKLTHALAMLLAAAASWLVSHAVSPASASQPTGLATAAQVEALDGKVERFIERITSIELKQAVQAEQLRQVENRRK